MVIVQDLVLSMLRSKIHLTMSLQNIETEKTLSCFSLIIRCSSSRTGHKQKTYIQQQFQPTFNPADTISLAMPTELFISRKIAAGIPEDMATVHEFQRVTGTGKYKLDSQHKNSHGYGRVCSNDNNITPISNIICT